MRLVGVRSGPSKVFSTGGPPEGECKTTRYCIPAEIPDKRVKNESAVFDRVATEQRRHVSGSGVYSEYRSPAALEGELDGACQPATLKAPLLN